MPYRRTLVRVTVLTMIACAAGMLAGCGKSAVTAAQWAARAADKQVAVHRALKSFDAATAKAGVAELEGISKSAQSAAAVEGTPAAREAAKKARASYRGADHEHRTSWIEDLRGHVKDEAKEEIRKAFRRAACDEVKTMLDNGIPHSSQRYAAEVALYLHSQRTDVDSASEAYRVATQYFDVLSKLNPRDPDDQAVLSYLALTAFCPDAVPSLETRVTGWGIVLTDQPVQVVNSKNQSIGLLAPGTMVQIECTIYWFEVTGPYGTSTLWDFIGTGYVPDSYLYTGTNMPVAPGC